jgi:asparagine synthase (glutamine-hydrolysing)
MCGICGVVLADSRGTVGLPDLARMNAALSHRGPDDEGARLMPGAGLAMRRLSIIDVAGGHQPIGNEDGSVWLVFNGEIYNHRALRLRLEQAGHRFRTRSDGEAIVHGYEQWGEDCVHHLNGMFAFAVWDQRRRRLLLARDHYGVKPIYYSLDGDRLVFGSEIKALEAVRPGSMRVDLDGLGLALRYGFIPSPHTFFAGVAKLGPGHVLTYEAGHVEVRHYAVPPAVDRGLREGEVIEELRARIRGAVERQLMSDVPVGALLSGGIDSTAVVTCMRPYVDRLHTYTVGVDGAPALDERPRARETAEHLSAVHREVTITASDYISLLERTYWHLEEPCTPSSVLNWAVCREASRDVKVVLTGQGADEPFAGYRRYRGEWLGQRLRRWPGPARRVAAGALRAFGARGRSLAGELEILGEGEVLSRIDRIWQVDAASGLQNVLSADVQRELARRPAAAGAVEALCAGVTGLTDLELLLYADLRGPLADNLLVFGDKTSMAASVEARVPLLDREVVEFAERIPGVLRLKGGRQKYLLKKAVAPWLPEGVLGRPKRAFPVPVAEWLRGPLGDFVTDTVTASGSFTATFLDAAAVRQAIVRHRQGQGTSWKTVFALLSLELLYKAFAVRRPQHTPAATPAGLGGWQ